MSNLRTPQRSIQTDFRAGELEAVAEQGEAVRPEDAQVGARIDRELPGLAPHGGGHAACIASFIASLRGGPARADLATACRSTMLAVMARTAVATGAPVAWHDLWQASPALRSARPLQSSRV
jgi:hypothetical protein